MHDRVRLTKTEILSANWVEMPHMPEGVNLYDADYQWYAKDKELYCCQTEDGPYVLATEPEQDYLIVQVWKIYPKLRS